VITGERRTWPHALWQPACLGRQRDERRRALFGTITERVGFSHPHKTQDALTTFGCRCGSSRRWGACLHSEFWDKLTRRTTLPIRRRTTLLILMAVHGMRASPTKTLYTRISVPGQSVVVLKRSLLKLDGRERRLCSGNKVVDRRILPTASNGSYQGVCADRRGKVLDRCERLHRPRIIALDCKSFSKIGPAISHEGLGHPPSTANACHISITLCHSCLLAPTPILQLQCSRSFFKVGVDGLTALG
jgi:hypothetical protein